MGVLIKMRNGVMFTIKGCFRAVYNHPFIVCLLCVLVYMYRSSPFMFSLLVSASPILVCTAVLLGTLLFFGQSNVPEIGITSRDFVPQKSELSKNETRDESEKPTVRPSLSESKVGEICSEDVTAPLNKKRSEETELGNREVLETNRERTGEKKREWHSDGNANDQESEYEKSEAESCDSEMVNVDSLASSGRSSWKQVEQQGDEDDDEEDSVSDEAESSSPDASMADMMPMLDELHPLLDEDAPQPIQISRAGSEAVSPRTSISSIESVEETDNQEDSVAEDDDDDDEDAHQDKGFRTKSAITWTEEDQKNLMEVGSSEIERNQRLENLILRRKTRKHTSMLPEINLIDLETSDFPINIASISTSRQNPFDMPHDSYDPIPGSAPSILLPRLNPFDILYDEQKQNIMGDGSQEEHKTMQSRNPFFRRRENFNVGPSVFAPNRQDLKLRPYFVPEQMDLEEPSYSTLQRQSSEMSDSKVSSVPDTESVSSVECGEDRKQEEEEEVTQDHVSKTELSEEDAPYEPEVISEIKHVSEDVGHGSQSSEGEGEGDGCLELGSVENTESDVKFQSESEAVEQQHSRGSSISSLSEVSQRKIDDDVPHMEPVYDSSPPKRANDDMISDLSGVDQRSDEQSQGDKNIGELEEERESAVPIGAPQVDNKETAMSPTSDADFEEACEKISTPSAGGSAPHFYVRAMHEKDFEHLEEVQVPNTPVEPSEKARGIQNIHIPELQEQLDRDVSPNTKSSFIPQSISSPEEAVDTRTMNEDAADEIKDIHQRLLSELDSAGDFTSHDLEKHIDAERVSSPHFSETSAVEVNPNPAEVNKIEHDISVIEVDPVEVNKTQPEMDMENSRGDEIEDIGTDHKNEIMLTQEEVEPNTNAQVKEETVESPVVKESSAREDDPHSTSDTETEKNSKSSSSFSSFWAKRRLSTPFF